MYYDRYETATTSKMLDVEHIVLCHDNKEKFNCIGNKGNLIQTNQPKGIQNNFNYGLSMLKKDEWGLFMSDDLVCGKRIVNGKFKKCDINYPLNELISILHKCDKMGVNLVGLASNDRNPINYILKNKYSKYGLVDGRCFAIKKTDFLFHNQINTIPDYYATIYHLNKYGGNLILNYCLLDFKRATQGGLGSNEKRLKDKIKDIQIIKKIFPNNIRIVNKPNQPINSHIVIKK